MFVLFSNQTEQVKVNIGFKTRNCIDCLIFLTVSCPKIESVTKEERLNTKLKLYDFSLLISVVEQMDKLI